MTDQYKPLRDALAAVASTTPWTQGYSEEGRSCVWTNGKIEPVNALGDAADWIDCNTEPNARYIAAANPDAIRALLAERDALREALEKLLAGTRAETAESWQCNSYHPKLISGMDAAAALVQGQGEKHDNQD